jgi:D-arabinose 1-dehydrogenase-like Zn-dependent alcohol dehydrogenase
VHILTGAVECKGCQVHNLNCETGGARIQGFGVDGFFAEYAAVDWRNAIHLPEAMEMKNSAPFFCAGITGTTNLLSLSERNH